MKEEWINKTHRSRSPCDGNIAISLDITAVKKN